MKDGYNGDRPLGVFIVPDEQNFPTLPEHKHRAMFLTACPLCKRDFEVRSGAWIDCKTPSGRTIRLKVCPRCAPDETTSVTKGGNDAQTLGIEVPTLQM